jgi:hypothetical protein
MVTSPYSWETGMRAVCVVASLVLSATPAGAQWLNYPTPGLPRTADGKPSLSARRHLAPLMASLI